MRDNVWLRNQLNFLLQKYFSNINLSNPIEIKFGREAKYRFGSIRLIKPRGFRFKLTKKPKEPEKSLITITGMFASEEIPQEVVWYTICHELCHYAHGFSSANKRLFRYPHHGGIINKELTERGAQALIPHYKKWIREYRANILKRRG